MKVTEITELIDRVQEQLDNNWAVEKRDIKELLDLVSIATTLTESDKEFVSDKPMWGKSIAFSAYISNRIDKRLNEMMANKKDWRGENDGAV